MGNMTVEGAAKRRGRKPAVPRHIAPQELAARYDKYFEVLPAPPGPLLEATQSLRYQTLCEERQLLRSQDYPEKLEQDRYDTQSRHAVLRHRADNSVVGALRVILPAEGSMLPAMLRCAALHEEIGAFRTAELSRFVIAKHFRRRWNDGFYGEVSDLTAGHTQREIPHMAFGLFRQILEFISESNVTHVAAMAEPAMLKMLGGLGIHFAPVGGLLESHGLRQPCYAKVETLLRRMKKEKPDIWNFVTDSGRLA